MNAAFLENLKKPCICGRTHPIYTRDVLIKSGALFEMRSFLVKHGFGNNGVIVCDDNTWMAAGQTVSQVLNSKNCIILPAKELHANEAAVEQVLAKSQNAAYYVAVGAGTIHDVSRYCAHQRNVDFISVPTAASVDGFASNVAAMTFNGMKVTTPARPPRLVVADLDVLADAPYRLTAAGVGDILGKYTSLADWRIACLVNGEYFCQAIYDLQQKNIADVVAMRKEIRRGNHAALAKLIDALIMSGITIQMMGTSRAASGVEHHISHLWEMHALGNEYDALHGEKVGVGTAVALRLYRSFLNVEDITPFIRPHQPITPELVEPAYGPLTPYVMKENTPDVLATVDGMQIAAHFDEIKDIIRALPTQEDMHRLLEDTGAPVYPADVGISDELLDKTLQYCVYARNRLTLYRMTLLMQPEFVRSQLLI